MTGSAKQSRASEEARIASSLSLFAMTAWPMIEPHLIALWGYVSRETACCRASYFAWGCFTKNKFRAAVDITGGKRCFT
jgi:hypothetical protein